MKLSCALFKFGENGFFSFYFFGREAFHPKLEQKFIRFVLIFCFDLLNFTKYNLDPSWIPCKAFASIIYYFNFFFFLIHSIVSFCAGLSECVPVLEETAEGSIQTMLSFNDEISFKLYVV